MASPSSSILGIANKEYNLSVGMRNFYVFARMAMFCIAWLVGFEGVAQSRYWVGGSGNWSDSQHWSYTSGGVVGAAVPNINDVVYIDKNSFRTDGNITLDRNVEVGGLIWSDLVSKSGFNGNHSITINGALNYGSEVSWAGTLILTSAKSSYVAFPSTAITANILFEPQANYSFLTGVNTRNRLEVKGEYVNFMMRTIKAKPLIAPSTVKATGKSGFLKATTSDGGVYKVSVTVENAKCPGGSDGSASVDLVENGTPPYKYQWKDASYNDIPGATSSKLTGLSQGFYVVQITDSSLPNPMIDLVKVSVQDPNPLVFVNFTVIEPTCNGSSTAIINSSLVGGTPLYTYSLDNGTNYTTTPVSGLAIAGLSAGTYNLKVKDKNLCTYSYPINPIVINQPEAINISTSKTDVTGCFGNTNGTLTITASGGTASSPLEYSIDGITFGSQSSFINLAAKTYTVAVRRVNDHSCVSTTNVTINQPAQLAANVVANPVSGCSVTPDGQIIISGATGGSGAYEYSNDGGASWSPTGSFTGLSAGTYNVIIRDASNITCIQTLNAALVVAAKPLLSGTVASTNITCFGSNNGTITITNPVGGSGVYEYSVQAGTWVSNGAFTNLAPATYTVQIRDKNVPTCARTIATINITQPTALNAAVTKVDVTGCSNASNGSISINGATGGSGQYEFSIDGTNWTGTSSFTNLVAKSYPVSMRDKLAPACIKPLGNFTLTAPIPLTSSFTKVDVTGCAGNTNGSITFTGTSGGSGQYDFSIDNGATWQPTASFPGIAAKSYNLVVRDRLTPTCAVPIGVANIIEPQPLSATVATSNVTCAGTSTGSITVSAATGGSGTFGYSKDNGATWQPTGSFPNLPVGAYQVVIRDAANTSCIKVLGTYNITQAAVITATVNVVNVTGCFGSTNGAINVTNPTGGSGAYEYSKDGATWVASGSFTNLAANSYPIYIRDVANKTCSVKLGDYNVQQPQNININSVVPVDPKCFGESTGSITVNATGGTAPLTYSIGGTFQSPNLFSNLAAGPFTVTVKDAAGCTKQSDVTLNPAQKIVPTVTKTDVTCAGLNTGQIVITGVTGGKAPYQYSIQGGAAGTYQVSNTFSNLVAGTYNVRIIDANSCESEIVTLVVKGAVVLDVVATPVDVRPCNGDKSGAINLTINSGTAPYQYNTGSGNQPLVGSSITGLGAGNYNLTITDGAGCVKNIGVITINQPSPIQITNVTPTDVTGCATTPNGSIFIAAGAGADVLSYSVDNGVTYGSSNNITGLGAGTYSIKVKNSYGCVVDGGSVTIKAPNPLTIDLATTAITNVKCNGDATGTITVAATGGTAPLTYSIGGAFQPETNFPNLKANTYTISVKDNGGCIQTAPVTITQPNVITPNLQVLNVSCNGLSDGRILVAPTGGVPNYTVTLNPASPFVSGAFNNLPANDYSVTVRDANSCVVTEAAKITQPNPIVLGLPSFTNPTCATGGTITASATGGSNPLKYSLMQGGVAIATNDIGSFTNVSGGDYTVEVTDANNCAKAVSSVLKLTSPSTIKFSNIAAPAITCNGGNSSISLTISGITGTPNVTLTKGGVAVTPAPAVTKVGADYNVSALNLSGGSYLISVTDSNDPSCTQTQAIDIVEPTALVLGTPTVVPPTSGNNGSISIIASGGTPAYTYSLNPGGISNGTGIYSNLGVGTYTVSVVDKNGCAASPATVTLSNLNATVSAKNVTCFGSKNGELTVDILGGASPYTVLVTGPNGYSQNFNTATNQQVVSGLDKGTYSVVVTDNNGTSVTKTATITEPTALTIALQNGTATLCAGSTTGKIDVAINGGTPNYTITWVGDDAGTPVPGGTLVGQSITNLAAAHYVVTVTDGGGCIQTAEHTIVGNPALNLSVNSTNPQCGNPTSGTITLTTTGGNGVYTYTNDGITFNNTTGTYTGLTEGTYKVAVKDGLGCQSSTQDVVLTSPTAINIVSVNKTDTKCAIGGTITVVAGGGSGALTYKLLRAGSKVLVVSNTVGEFNDVPLGNYLVEVTDGGTCPATTPTISIVSGGGTTNIKVTSYTVDNIKCFGDKGTVRINVTGVQGVLSCVFVNRTTGVTLVEGVDYFFAATAGANPGEYSIVVSGFDAGSYNMFISDDNACPQKFPFGISAPTKLVFDSVTKVDPSSKTSANGSITAVVSGGVKPYTYSLEGTTQKNTTGIFTGLNPGKYRVIVEDKNHCIATSEEVELIALSNLNIDDIILTNPKCHAETNGSIDIYASGGNGAMKYSIDGGTTFQTDKLFSNLKAGVYDVVVEDAAGVRATQQVTLADPEAIVIKVVNMKTPSADGTSDGSIVVIATGGSGLYSYSLIDENTGQELSNATTGSVEVNFNKLPSGTYRIIATDENGCVGEVGPITLEELSLNITATDLKCSNDKVGKLDIEVKGGIEPFKLTWQAKGGTLNGPFDVTDRKYTISDLTAGDYVVSVTDATNSVYTTVATIKSPIALVATLKSVTSPICAGTTDGVVELEITGGKPDYAITWVAETPNPNGDAGTVTGTTISGLYPSKYDITITDANGCTSTLNTEIASNPEIVIDQVEPTMPKCNGEKGSVKVTATGGVGELKYSTTIDGTLVESTTGQFDNLSAGTYTISVTDTKGCVNKSTDVVITEPNAIVVAVKEVADQTCTSKGKVTVEATGGTGKLTYVLGSTTNETGIFDNLDAGKYTVTVTDEVGCTGTVDVEVKSTATLKITNVIVEDVKCNGSATGKISFNVEGAATGLVVIANGNAITPDASNLYVVDNLPVGAVTINVKDDSGCDISEQHNIQEPTAVTATIRVTKVPTSPTDNSGNIEVVASGGSGFYTITCFDKATGSELSSLNIGEGIPANFNKLQFGTYTITVVDERGCTFTSDVTLANLEMTAKGISGSCNDPKGSIEVTITDGAKPYVVSYTKKDDATVIETKDNVNDNVVTFTNVDPGDYTVKVVDASNTAVTSDVTIAVYAAPTLALVSKCYVNNTHYIEITIPEGLKDYTVTCIDADGLSYTTYDPVMHRINGVLPNKTYTVQVIDAVGCSSEALTVEMGTIPEMKIEDPTITNVLCYGAASGKVELKASGGTGALSYFLRAENSMGGSAQDSPVFENQLAGKYHAIILDGSGCFDSRTIEITQPTEMQFAIDDATTTPKIWCATKLEGKLGFTVADATPGYTIKLLNSSDNQVGDPIARNDAGDGLFEGLRSGKYKLVAIDKNGCEKSIDKEIEGNHISLDFDATPSECRRFVEPDGVKTHGGTFTIKDIYGDFDPSVAYYFRKGYNLSSEPVEPTANPEGDGYYLFKKGESRTISQLEGIYYTISVKVVDAVRGTCEDYFGFTIPVNPANDFDAVATPDKAVCINSTVDFLGNIEGNTDQSKYEINADGSIKQDGNGNPVYKRYFLQWMNVENPRLDVEYGSLDNAETQDKIKKQAKITYKMVKKDGKTYTLAHPYILRVTSRNDVCYDEDTAKVEVYPYSYPYITGPLVKTLDEVGHLVRIPVGAEQDIELKYHNSNDFEKTVTWEPIGASWFIPYPDNSNKFTIYGTTLEDQTAYAKVTYKVKDAEVCEEVVGLKVKPIIWINPPNAFTPNGDGYNDTWRVLYDEEMSEYPDLEVEIYNRWGSLVYNAKPYKNDWNGRHNGKDLPVGTYYYVIKLHRGMAPNVTGAVSIIR